MVWDKTKESDAHKIVNSKIVNFLNNRKFNKLSDEVEDLLKSKKLYINGKLMHTEYYDQIILMVQELDDPIQYKKEIEIAEKQIKKNPKKPFNYLYYSILVQQEAWNERGSQFTHKTSVNSLNDFSDKIEKNIDFLLENKNIASKDPFYYVLLLWAYQYLGKENELTTLYKEGIELYPNYRPIYNTYLGAFEPRYQGYNLNVVKNVIDDIQRKNPQKTELYYYHILYTALKIGYKPSVLNVDWNLVEKGVVQSLEQLPSLERINQVWELYCSTSGNKHRLENLTIGFEDQNIQRRMSLYVDQCPN